MHDEMPPSGALPMKSKTSKKSKRSDQGSKSSRDARPEDADTSSTKDRKSESGSVSAAGSKSRGNPLNPYCNCDPCTCPPPCTCGLKQTARETRTEWREDRDELVFTITETWKPSADGDAGSG